MAERKAKELEIDDATREDGIVTQLHPDKRCGWIECNTKKRDAHRNQHKEIFFPFSEVRGPQGEKFDADARDLVPVGAWVTYHVGKGRDGKDQAKGVQSTQNGKGKIFIPE